MRRVFYGDQSKNSIALLQQIKDATGIDLVRQAGLSKFAVENFGDDTQKTGLRQAISGGIGDAEALGGVKTRILSTAYRHLMAPLTPDTQAMAMSLAKGRDYSLGKIGEKLDDFIQGPEGAKLQGAFEVGMKNMGVPSTMIKTAAQRRSGWLPRNGRQAARSDMARRMFSPEIVNTDAFIDMPISTQALYFHLGMNADDDGFVGPKKIMRMLGMSDDDLRILIAKRFAIPFESGVIVIRHWKVNNLVRKDWYRPTIHREEKQT